MLVIEEGSPVSRLLKPGGCFVFTDPMAADADMVSIEAT